MQHDIQIANTASNLMLCNKWYYGLRGNHIESCIGTSIWPTKRNDCIKNLKFNNTMHFTKNIPVSIIHE